jgi:hypothetical protein
MIDAVKINFDSVAFTCAEKLSFYGHCEVIHDEAILPSTSHESAFQREAGLGMKILHRL